MCFYIHAACVCVCVLIYNHESCCCHNISLYSTRFWRDGTSGTSLSPRENLKRSAEFSPQGRLKWHGSMTPKGGRRREKGRKRREKRGGKREERVTPLPPLSHLLLTLLSPLSISVLISLLFVNIDGSDIVILLYHWVQKRQFE